jgi:hypothetical protein
MADSKNEYPDYVLAKNQIDSDENRRLFKAALTGSITGRYDSWSSTYK